MRLRLFALLPMMKYAVTALFPSSETPTTIPRPGYGFPESSAASDLSSMQASCPCSLFDMPVRHLSDFRPASSAGTVRIRRNNPAVKLTVFSADAGPDSELTTGFRKPSSGFTVLRIFRPETSHGFTGLRAPCQRLLSDSQDFGLRGQKLLPPLQSFELPGQQLLTALTGKQKCLPSASRQECQRSFQAFIIVHGKGLIQENRQVFTS